MFRTQSGFFAAVSLGLIGLIGPLGAAVAQDVGGAAWAGTVEVERKAHVVLPDGANRLVIEESQRVVYTLRGDGSQATFEASHHSKTSAPAGTSRVDGRSSGVAELGIEYLDTYQDGSFWHLFMPAVQVQVTRQASRVPGVTRDRINTEQAVVELGAPRGAQALSGRFTRPWRGDLYEAAPKIGGTAQATETVTVRLQRVSRTGAREDDTSGVDHDPLPPPPPPAGPRPRGVLPYPQVTIHGPACACPGRAGAVPEPLRYTATASWSGGTFGAFALDAGRRAPQVLANAGGDHPRLELLAEAPIDPVTIGIDYHYQGFVYAAEPLVVQWCAREPVQRSEDRMALAAGLLGSALSQDGEQAGRLLRERLQQELAGADAADAAASPCMD